MKRSTRHGALKSRIGSAVGDEYRSSAVPPYFDPDLAVRFGERVRQYRLTRKWSVAQLAKRLGVTRTTIARIEAGKSFPGARIGQFARVLQVTLADLFTFPGAEPSKAPAKSALAEEYPAIYAAVRQGLQRDPKFARRVERILEALIAK